MENIIGILIIITQQRSLQTVMKIGEFSDSFLPVVDGVGRVAYSYCDHIARKGHECSAIVPLTKMGYRGQTGRTKAPFILLTDAIRIFDHKSPSLSFLGL